MITTQYSGQSAGRFIRLTALLALLVALFLGAPTSAWSQTAEQLETFRTLPPDQQRAVLEAMGGQSGSGGISGGVRSDRDLTFPDVVRRRGVRTGLNENGEDELGYGQDPYGASGGLRVPRFRGGDTVLINLEIKEFEDQRAFREPDDGLASGQLNESRAGNQATGQGAAGAGQAAPVERERIERTEEAQRRLRELRDRIHRRNPYRLDSAGVLHVPDLGPIALAGLTVEEATKRLAAEAALVDYMIDLTRLPLQPTGTDALKPFGYDLFAGVPTTFAPATDVPVPAEYVVGPGDRLEVQLIGSTKGRYSLVVGRDGRINFPELGPITVGGHRFDDVREDLEQRVRDQMIGTQVSVTIGELRSIRVFVLGDAEVPGSYAVSGLSTITNALFVSGGVKHIGSLRNIQLKRGGRTVSNLDLYDLLLGGDTSADARLLPGDVIFVPPVGATVSVDGEVRRPAIYELKGETTVRDLVSLGGGMTPRADGRLATLERVNDDRKKVTLNVDLSSQQGLATPLRAGDVLRIPAIRPVLEDSVSLSGHVYRPLEVQYRDGMRLTDVIPSVDELMPNADQHYVLIRRELPPDRYVTVFSASLADALANPSSAANIELSPRDRIHVFDLESGRDRIIEPLMRELRMQSRIEDPTREVSISGRVKVPGKYPLEPGMRLTDLLRAGGGLSEAAFGGQAELTRYVVGEDNARKAELIEFDLRAALRGEPAANVPLQPFDHVVIKEVPLWASQEEVEIGGEVRFPGKYPIQRGETLASLLKRAGGLTDFAFPEGAVFTRRELRERERKQVETLATRMQSDLAQLSLMAAQESGRAGEALSVGQSLLANLRSTPPVGRLVIDLKRSISAAPGSEHDIILKDGDRVLIPRVTQEVTVIGEVQSSTSHLYNPGRSRNDYISMSGGTTSRADVGRIYVVRANGSVETRENNFWFNRGGVEIRPGDTIVVPLDTERIRPLPFWQAVTSIIYNLAISVAAVNSF